MKLSVNELSKNSEELQRLSTIDPNENGKSDDPDSEEVERENGDDDLLPEDDDFEENYGELEDGHDDLAIPDSDKNVDNLE